MTFEAERYRQVLSRIIAVGMSLSFVLAAAVVFPEHSFAVENVSRYNGVVRSSYGNGSINGNGAAQPVVIKSIAVLPFDNLSGELKAPDLVNDQIKSELRGKGWVYLAKDADVEDFLARRRIRYTGAVTRLTAREIGKILNVDAVCVGTITQYGSYGGKISVGVSMRLVSTLNGAILWADNLTYTGIEFEGLLGLGAVKSLDVLASMVVKDLVKGVAEKFFVRDTAMSPFEIERVITFPAIGKAGERIELMVDIVPIYDEPKEVRAIINGVEIILRKVKEGEYVGDFLAPVMDGIYAVDVIAVDESMVPFYYDAATNVTIDSAPPEVEMTLSGDIFAPKSGKYVTGRTVMKNFDNIEEWYVEIENAAGNIIRHERGFGLLPRDVTWHGENDKMSMAPDGDYKFTLILKDAAGNETRVAQAIRVKNEPSAVNVAVDIVDGVAEFKLERASDSAISEWTFVLKEKDGNTLKIFSGNGADMPEKIAFPLDDIDLIRRLVFSVTTKDVVGNTFTATNTMPGAFRGKLPFAEIKGKDRVWQEF